MGRARSLHRDIRHNEDKIAHDRYKLRRDLERGDYHAARKERRKLRQEHRGIDRDRSELGWY